MGKDEALQIVKEVLQKVRGCLPEHAQEKLQSVAIFADAQAAADLKAFFEEVKNKTGIVFHSLLIKALDKLSVEYLKEAETEKQELTAGDVDSDTLGAIVS